MEQEIEYVIRDGRFWRRTVVNADMGSQEGLLNQLTSAPTIMLRGVAELNDTPVHMLLNPSGMTLLMAMKELPFRSWFAPASDGTNRLYLTFVDNGNDDCLNLTDNWPVPKGMKIYFGLHFPMMGGSKIPGEAQKTFLFLYQNKEAYHFPYPNLYTDGKVCMGTTWVVNHRDGYYKQLSSGLDHFMSTSANSDLTGASVHEFFKRTYEGWVEPVTPMTHCRLISNAALVGLDL